MGIVAHEQMMKLRAKRQQLKPKNRRMNTIRGQSLKQLYTIVDNKKTPGSSDSMKANHIIIKNENNESRIHQH
jgi:hypothetical protein